MKRNFLTGMIILLPLAVTILVVMLIVDLLTQPFLHAMEKFLLKFSLFNPQVSVMGSQTALKVLSQVFILIGIFFAILVLGLFARWFVFKALVGLSDKIIHRIPFVNKLYKTFKEVINVLFHNQNKAFKQVVMIAFPNPDVYSIGFLSREAPPYRDKVDDKKLISIFIPTTPNPTTGYLIQFPEKEVKHLDMTVEDALKFIVSCGMIIPPKMQTEQTPEAKQ